MAHNDGQVRFCQQMIALNDVAHIVGAEIIQVWRFRIVVNQMSWPELIHNLLSQVPIPFLKGIFAVQPRSAEQCNVF